jgi:hypothetical protein
MARGRRGKDDRKQNILGPVGLNSFQADMGEGKKNIVRDYKSSDYYFANLAKFHASVNQTFATARCVKNCF